MSYQPPQQEDYSPYAQNKIPASARRLTVLPKRTVPVMRKQPQDSYVKPIATTMKKMFPSVDGVCDAPFVKRIFGLTSKKNAVLFIADCKEVYEYFIGMEKKMAVGRDQIRQEIAQHISNVEIQKKISGFKVKVKQKEAEQKLMKKELERQAIREQEAESIISEARNRVLAEAYQQEADAARQRGDEIMANMFAQKAQAAMQAQQQMEAIAESASSGSTGSAEEEEEEPEEAEYSPQEQCQQQPQQPMQPMQPMQQMQQPTMHQPVPAQAPSPMPQPAAAAAPVPAPVSQDPASVDIAMVKRLIEATVKQGFILARAGDQEFEVANLVIDKELEKLVINLTPIKKETQPKIQF